jgi:hypothetical protein
VLGWAGHVASVGRGTCRVQADNFEETRPYEISSPRWEDNMQIDVIRNRKEAWTESIEGNGCFFLTW